MASFIKSLMISFLQLSPNLSHHHDNNILLQVIPVSAALVLVSPILIEGPATVCLSCIDSVLQQV